MVYKINVYDVYDVPFPPEKTELMADVSLEIDNIVLVNGIKIKERTDGSLYVEMPKIADTENKDIFEGKSKFVAIPSNKEFATELYSNIIKTYRSKKTTYEVNINEPDSTNYTINAYPSRVEDYKGVVNLELEGCFKIKGIELKEKHDGLHCLISPQVKSGEYDVPVCTFIDENFQLQLTKNSVAMVDDIKYRGYSQEDLLAISDINDRISTNRNKIYSSDHFVEYVCKAIDKWEVLRNDEKTEALEVDRLRREIDLGITHLGMAVYEKHECNLQLIRDMELKKEIESRYDNKINNLSVDSIKKGSAR